MYMYLMSIYDQEKKKKKVFLPLPHLTLLLTVPYQINRQTSNKNHNSKVTLVFINQ